MRSQLASLMVAVNPPRRSSLAVPAAPPLSISGSPVLTPCLPLHAARKPLYSSRALQRRIPRPAARPCLHLSLDMASMAPTSSPSVAIQRCALLRYPRSLWRVLSFVLCHVDLRCKSGCAGESFGPFLYVHAGAMLGKRWGAVRPVPTCMRRRMY
jgi:hypothetical protein